MKASAQAPSKIDARAIFLPARLVPWPFRSQGPTDPEIESATLFGPLRTRPPRKAALLALVLLGDEQPIGTMNSVPNWYSI